MALMLVDVGADQILKAYLNNSWPASKDLVVKLFTNDYTPVDTDTTAQYTEAAGGGYVTKTLANGSWTITVGNDPSDGVFAEQIWTFTGPLSGNAIIYGYYIVDNNGSGVLVWAERLAASFQPSQNGDQLKITPKFQLSKGTPS